MCKNNTEIPPNYKDLTMKPEQIVNYPKVSSKCGKDNCEFWDSKSQSKCNIYNDRRLCSISMKQRRNTAHRSRRRGDTTNWY
jgi:hypothetical protein